MKPPQCRWAGAPTKEMRSEMATEEQTIADDSNAQQVDGQISEQLGIDAPDATYSLELSQDQKDIREWAHGFAEQTVRPAAHEWDEKEEFPWPVVQEAAKIGLYGFESIAQFWADPSGLTFPMVNEELFWGDAGIGMSIFGTTLAVAGIFGSGTPEQLVEWVPQCFGDENDVKVGAFCASEPDAGSDVSAYRTTAKYDEAKDEWVINGQKAWATNGGIANVHVVIASVDRELGSPRPRRLRHPARHQGPRAGRQGEEARHPRLAIPPTSTWTTAASPAPACWAARRSSTSGSPRPARARAPRARPRCGPSSSPGPTVGAQAVGIARAAYEYALDYAKEREAFGRKIIENQAIAFALADMKMEIDAARLLVHRAAWMGKTGKDFDAAEGSMSKLKAGEVAVWATERAIQILGGNGYSREFPVERMHRDAKIWTIFEGTSEIQRLVISRAISGVHIK